MRDRGLLSEQTAPEMEEVYACSRGLDLPFLDYLTVRDLLELGGPPSNDPALVAVLLTLFQTLAEGSLCLDLQRERLQHRLQGFLPEDQARQMTRDFLSRLQGNAYAGLIALHDRAYLPLVVSRKGERSLLYFQKYHITEEMLRFRMERLLAEEPSSPIPEPEVEMCLREIFSDQGCLRIVRGGRPISRDPLQVDAIRLALKHSFCIISGGPGTGKTSLMVNLLRCLVRTGTNPEDILLGAPTGRAGQRMTEALQWNLQTIQSPSPADRKLMDLKGSTLHRLLQYQPARNDFHYGDGNPLPASVILVDEVSMVDVVMMERFLRAVDTEKTRVVFLGDKDQLPSVEAGAVFAEMIPRKTGPGLFQGRLQVLETVYRTGKNLLGLARTLRDGVVPPEDRFLSFTQALEMKEDEWAFVRNQGPALWKEHLRLWTTSLYLKAGEDRGPSFKDLATQAGDLDSETLLHSVHGQALLEGLFRWVGQGRILSLVREGLYGCVGINGHVARFLGLELEPVTFGKRPYFHGAVVMVTRNDYSRELFNGDVGVILRDRVGAYMAFFPRSGAFMRFSMEALPPWELAFSTTVHKAQGSEFNDVLMVFPSDESHRLLTREMVYTGITRAKKRVLVYGSRAGLQAALARKTERQSGLGW